YSYFGDTRKNAYALVRRYKTIWPDRPVLWLSNGIGVYERTPVKFDFRTPGRPLTTLGIRAYTDSVVAYAAGADTGWFSYFAFQRHDWINRGMASLRGPTLRSEDLYPGSVSLTRAIRYSFDGLADKQKA